MEKHLKNEGIILKRINTRDADQIVTVLTKDQGKISVLAKGCRRLKSKFCGKLEPFYQVRLSTFQGRSLHHLNEAELLSGGQVMDLPLKSKTMLFYLAEITDRMIQEDQQVDGLYALLTGALDHLPHHPLKDELILQSTLIKMLTLLGFMAPWNQCARSQVKLELSEPLFLSLTDASVIRSGYQSSADPRLTPSLIKLVNFIQHYPLAAVLKVAVSKGEHAQISHLLRIVFQNLFHSPFRAEVFLNQVL